MGGLSSVYNEKCCNVDHLVWEPSWMIRLRDNCRDGYECKHGPDRCLRPHRYDEDVNVEWTDYLTTDQKALYRRGLSKLETL